MRTLAPETRDKLTRHFMGQQAQYVTAVKTRARLTSLAEREKVMRFEALKMETSGRWTFDINKAVKPLLWMAANLRFPLGEKRGKPLSLQPWQVFDIMDLFGWVDRATGLRKYLQGYLQVARKNGKSTMAGAILDYLAFGDGYPGVICYNGANSLEQAAETFERAAASLELAGHDGVKIFNSMHYKRIKYSGCEVRAISSQPKDGKLPHGVLLDEYHQAKTNELRDSFLSGNVSDPEALTLIITTAGTSLGGVCHEEYKKCKSILAGNAEAERYWVSIYECEEGDSVDDEKAWQKANPNWGVSVLPDLMRSRYEVCAPSAPDMVDFKTKNLNVWVYSLQRWCNTRVWLDKCCGKIGDKTGQRCYGGLDLASVSDFAAFCADFPDGERHEQLYHFWVPGNKVVELERMLLVPLRQWVHDGLVSATPGDVIDYTVLGSWLEDFRAKYDLRLIAADRWRLNELVRLMPAWFSEITVEFSQSMQKFSGPIQAYERQYLTGGLCSGGNPVMTWMMSCAESWSDTNGNVKLVKPKIQRSASRIDGVIASIMAFSTAIEQEPKGMTAEDVKSMIMFI